MSSTIHNQPTLSKLGSLLFARQTPRVEAEQHGSVKRGLQAWRARRAAAAELYALSDRSLADIGISRGEIPAILRTVR